MFIALRPPSSARICPGPLVGLCVLALTMAGCAGGGAGVSGSGFGDASGGGSGGSGGSDDGRQLINLGGADILAPIEEEEPDTTAPLCEAGTHVCTSTTSWAVCDSSGDGMGLEHVCATTARCDPKVGVCLPIVCEAGEVSCADWQTVQQCDPSGTGHTSDEPCPDGGVCQDGACVPCWAGQSVCKSLYSVGQCAADGSGIVEGSLTLCPEGQVCRGSEGVCIDPVCEPDSWRCLNPFVYQPCDATGSGWVASDACPPDFVCKQSEGGCVYRPCEATVLFVVDRSGSMEPHWQAVHGSVSQLVGDNPDAIFGLLDFPTAFGSTACGTSAALQIGFDFADDTAMFDAYFNGTPPQGATPLVEALEVVAANAVGIFSTYQGSIVVLSDGGDTCAEGELNTRLQDAVTELHVVHGVSTYVIGYNYAGDGAQLDAIASAGGTSFPEHVAAGDEAALLNAFQAVVTDIKLCGR